MRLQKCLRSIRKNMMNEQSESSAAILLYHGVTASESHGIENFSGKHVFADEFSRQMEFLAENAQPLSLREVAGELSAGRTLPPDAVAITFDDSFRNIRNVAHPILVRYGIPCTFFVSTGFVGTGRRFWVDIVEHAINLTQESHIIVDLGGNRVERFELCADKEKIAAVVQIKSAMKAMAPDSRSHALKNLRAATKIEDLGGDVENYKNLEWDDVRALDKLPNYEVGGHTVNHEILSYLSPENLESEVIGCLNTLRLELGHDIDLFSYPEGQRDHFDDRVISCLRRNGVTVCPSAIHGLNVAGADPFHLRRIMVGFMGEPFPSHLFRGNA